MFTAFPKLARLSRDMVITEKLDGTNAQVEIIHSLAPEPGALAHKSLGDAGDLSMFAASRSRYILPTDDNYGFAKWVQANSDQLWSLGVGRHYGEWWGAGIQRRYGLTEKRFSLFNVNRWLDDAVRPACCHVVPRLMVNTFDTNVIDACLNDLRIRGSWAAPGFMQPEGIVVFHTASGTLFKKTLEHDAKGKDA